MSAVASVLAGGSLSLCLRLNVPSHSDGAGVAGNRFRLPTEEYPRPRRASSWLITHSPTCSTLKLANDTPTVRTSGPSTHHVDSTGDAVMSITSSDASIGSQIRTLPTGTMTLAPVG